MTTPLFLSNFMYAMLTMIIRKIKSTLSSIKKPEALKRKVKTDQAIFKRKATTDKTTLTALQRVTQTGLQTKKSTLD